MSTAMHWAGLLGSPRRTSDVTYMGAQGAATWHPEMLWAAFGGTLVAIAVLMFIIVATGTYVANVRAEVPPTFEFASTDEDAMATPADLRPPRKVGRNRPRARGSRLRRARHARDPSSPLPRSGHANVVNALALAAALAAAAFVPLLGPGDTIPATPFVDQSGHAFSIEQLRGNAVSSASSTRAARTRACARSPRASSRSCKPRSARAPIRLLEITLDPQFDTPARAARVRSRATARIRTAGRWRPATSASIEELAARLGIATRWTRPGTLVHTEAAIVVDRDGPNRASPSTATPGRRHNCSPSHAKPPERNHRRSRRPASWLTAAIEACSGARGTVNALEMLALLLAVTGAIAGLLFRALRAAR